MTFDVRRYFRPWVTIVGMTCTLVAVPTQAWRQQVEREGVRIDLQLDPAQGSLTPPTAGQTQRLRVSLTGSDGSALSALPGLWIDPADGVNDGALARDDCTKRVARYLAPGVLARAWADLSGYDVLLLNEDASISVLDPRTQFAGTTSLRARIDLPGKGFDWLAHPRSGRLYVAIAQQPKLAVADLVAGQAVSTLGMPGVPSRLALEPSGQRLWVGIAQAAAPRTNTSVQADRGGVAVVDAAPPHAQRWVPTGDGHHEIAFTPSGVAAVTNRDSGTVSFIHPRTLLVEATADTQGGLPLGVVHLARRDEFWVSDARRGELLRYAPGGSLLGKLALAPGIGPMQLSPDGQWLFVLNPARHDVRVIDVAGATVAHSLPIAARPFQVTFTDRYAYVRALDSESVAMVSLASLGSASPIVQRFAAGEHPPGLIANLPVAAQMAPMPDNNGVFALSPKDNAVYTYMQGMNAASSSMGARGHEARAVLVARRGLREVQRGVYEAELRMPDSTQAVLALATDNPRMRHCVTLNLQAAPRTASNRDVAELRWTTLPRPDAVPRELAFEVRLVSADAQAGGAAALPRSWPLRMFQAGGSGAIELMASLTADTSLPQGSGRYTAVLPALASGSYYVHAAPPARANSRAVQNLDWSYASFVLP